MGLSQKHNIPDQHLWNNYVLLCPLSLVKEAIESEKQVYLTLINTPEEVIIGGMDLSPLYSLSSPSFKKNQIVEETMTLSNHTTDNIVMQNNQPEILPEKYYTLPISPPSQQYELLEFSQSQPRYSMDKNSILTEEPRVMSKLIANNYPTSTVLLRDQASTDLLEQSISLPPKVSVGSRASLSHSVEVNDTVLPQEDNIFIAEERNDKALLKNNRKPEIEVDKKQLANLRNSQYENLMNNAFNMAQNHKALLEIRQVSLHQISTIIDQQLNLYRTLFNQSSD